MRKIIAAPIIAAPIVAGLIGMAALAAPLAASAATAGNTTGATFAISGGDLTISAPADGGSLGAYTAGASTRTFSHQIGTVIVTDNRALVIGSWNATATTTDFTTGTSPTADQTVPAADITYSPGSAFAPVNSPATTDTPGAGGAMDNTTGVAAMGTSNESGVGAVSWDPTLDVALPAQVVAGTYSGTITHSVA